MNRNIVYSQIFVDELVRAGLKQVCIAPGSRSTPLTMAFIQHAGIRVYSHLDERSMAFFALGLALASDKPVALLCTSGSAAANFFPAIVEAHQSRIPLIVLTSDRPPEMRHSGANQTIDQIKLYGDYALWFVDAVLPESSPAPVTTRYLRALAARAVAKSTGIRRGVVHLNIPFRKPLEPTPDPVPLTFERETEQRFSDTDSIPPFTEIIPVQAQVDSSALAHLAQVIKTHPRGLIVCGARHIPAPFVEEVIQLARITGYPLLSDAASGVRFGTASPEIIGGTELYGREAAFHQADVLIRFGDVPTSPVLMETVSAFTGRYHYHIRGSGDWADDSYTVSHFIGMDEVAFCRQIQGLLSGHQATIAPEIVQREQIAWESVAETIGQGQYFDGAAVYDVIDLIPAGSTLFTGNSLAIRHFDGFGKPSEKHLHTYASRGASGIDGNLSTALGAGAARPDSPLVAIVGDITFYHDMNGLLAVQRCGVPITIVLLNNNGGGIFHRLPIKDFDPEFTEHWVTPHGLDFSHAARLYGLDYVKVTARGAFRQAFSDSVQNRRSSIIELPTDAKTDLARRAAVIQAVQSRLRG